MKNLIQRYISYLLEQNKIKKPPIDVDQIAESLKIKVIRQPYESKNDLSAMLIRDGDKVK